MQVVVIGSGNVGGTLGRRWSELGHEVRYAERGRVAEAAREAEVVVLATPWAAVPVVAAQLAEVEGLLVIDATNPIGPGFALDVGLGGESGAERLASRLPGARVVKAFNTVGFNVMANPVFDGRPAVLCYCGDDAAAKKITHQLATELGFQAVDAGPLAKARLLEPFALLWITLAMQQGWGREIGFGLMKR